MRRNDAARTGTCQRKGCGATFQASSVGKLRKRKYCSRACGVLASRGGPFFGVCARVECGALFEVRKRSILRVRKHCSHRCASLAAAARRGRAAFQAAGRKGGAVWGRRAQRRALARVKGLSPLEAFRRGYDIGLQSKLRQIRKRYRLVPIEEGR